MRDVVSPLSARSATMTKTGLNGLARSSIDHLLPAGQRQSRAEGHHLVAEPCRRICVRNAGGCLAGSIIKPMVESMGLSWQQGPLSISMALSSISSRAQTVVPHGPDRNLDVYDVVHESGGVSAAAASG